MACCGWLASLLAITFTVKRKYNSKFLTNMKKFDEKETQLKIRSQCGGGRAEIYFWVGEEKIKWVCQKIYNKNNKHRE